MPGGGRKVLFSSRSPSAGTRGQVPPPDPPAGSAANPLANRGPIVVECAACRAVTRVGLVDFLIFQLPFGAWLPRGRFDRRMTCPACRRRVWASVTLRPR